jgi:gliding motility-associated-like protein
VTLTLTTHPVKTTALTAEICLGETYSQNGFNVTPTEAGEPTHTQNLQTARGCDSTVTLKLTVYPNYDHHFDVVACDSLIWNGHVYHQSGSYTQQFSSSHGCDSTVTKDVQVVNTYLELVNHTPDFCENFEADLEVFTELDNIRWSSGETNVHNIVAHHAGAYVVTANTAHCQAFARLVIPACAFNLYIPNAITPSNDDGTNDFFCLPEGVLSQIELFEICIFDRWGRMVFRSESPHFRWDGREKGKLKVNNTYTYYIKLSVFGGGDYLYKGVVTVL